VGLRHRRAAALAAVALFCAASLRAAPKLRMASSTVGPLSIAQGASGGALQTETLEAYNAADGSLNLSLSSSVSWIVPSKLAQRACLLVAVALCTPLQFVLNTSALPAGTATGIVTVSDPNAVDAPQTITVGECDDSGQSPKGNVYVSLAFSASASNSVLVFIQ